MNKTKQIENLWQQYHPQVHGFIKRHVAIDDADEILQNVFEKVTRSGDRIDSIQQRKSWLFQIARNAIVDHYRRQKLFEQLPEELADPGEEPQTEQKLASCIEPLLKELPQKYRDAVDFADIQQRPQAELAATHEISLSAAKSRVQRGRKLLHGQLLDCCHVGLNHKNQLLDFQPKKSQSCCI